MIAILICEVRKQTGHSAAGRQTWLSSLRSAGQLAPEGWSPPTKMLHAQTGTQRMEADAAWESACGKLFRILSNYEFSRAL